MLYPGYAMGHVKELRNYSLDKIQSYDQFIDNSQNTQQNPEHFYFMKNLRRANAHSFETPHHRTFFKRYGK